ncbi:MAG: hypothetical protein CMO20_05510 [Thermoplasmata archaeon]|nr:hypothetical protein [Thermoplasmata archaeon]
MVSLMILSTISIQLGLSEYSFEIVEEYDENDPDEVTLNLAQKEALERASGRSGAVNWVKTAIPSSSSYNDIYNINGVHFHKFVMDHTNTNVLVGGTLIGSVQFDSIQPTYQPDSRAFVASLTKSGAWNWVTTTAVPTGNSGGSVVGDIAVAPNGKIWMSGSFWGEIEWGSDWELSDAGGIDGFVSTMSPSGVWDWGTKMGGTSNYDSMHDLVVDSNGDGYVVGVFEDHTYFDNTSYNILKGLDGFVTKVNQTNGTFEWVEIVGGNYDDNITAITIDNTGRIFVTGYYSGNINFGSFQVSNAGALSTFIAEIDSQGNWQWANEAKAVYGGIIPYAIEVNSNSIFIGGDVVGLIDLDGTYWWANATVQNSFVAKMNKTGSWSWHLNSDGHTQHISDITINPLGGVVAVGWFDMDHAYIANASFGNINLTSAPYAQFYAGVSPTGQWLWAETGGGMEFDTGSGALFVETGRLFVAGRYCVDNDMSVCTARIGSTNYTSSSIYRGSGFVFSLSTDSDMDDVSDLNDNCPLVSNTNQENFDGDSYGNLCDSDMDGDGLDDSLDGCFSGPAFNWDSSDWSIDSDSDGCRDSDEDDDDDNDGVVDLIDACSDLTTYKNWTANDANDYDRDGCHDTHEDDDDDGDGIFDSIDGCAYAPSDRNWTSNSSTDYDSDGCRDDGDEDDDDDNDGILDVDDSCVKGDLNWISNNTVDFDSDGCLDSSEDADDDGDGINDFDDACSQMAINWDSSGVQDLDNDGCRDVDEDDDDDGDGVPDSEDGCPRGSIGWISANITDNDGDGCRDSGEDLDDDNDLILDLDDGCYSGVTGWISTFELDADRDGCRDSDEDWDDDGDGLWEFDIQGNVIDQCPGTPLSEKQFIDNFGCSPSQADDDGDGVQNINDECPDVAAAEGLDRDQNGCTDDIDQDGFLDDVDAFPNDSTQQLDSDGDGYGDNLSGINGDACPNTPLQWVESAKTTLGCAWEEFDDDQDGLLNGDEDSNCTSTPKNETDKINIFGCGPSQIDSDNDGTSDLDDMCPDTKQGAEMAGSGCSKEQLSYNSGGDSGVNFLVIGLLSLVVIIVVGGGAAFFLLNRFDGVNDRDDSIDKVIEVSDAANDEWVGEQDSQDSDGNNGEITVDEDGTEWWQDESGVWWYRSVSMDDWAIFEE